MRLLPIALVTLALAVPLALAQGSGVRQTASSEETRNRIRCKKR